MPNIHFSIEVISEDVKLIGSWIDWNTDRAVTLKAQGSPTPSVSIEIDERVIEYKYLIDGSWEAGIIELFRLSLRTMWFMSKITLKKRTSPLKSIKVKISQRT
ncbi:hypothetical protein GEMRC1_002603 [Eukaryota sp. GEM-RC1]